MHNWLLYMGPGEGTPSMLGDMDVPPFWPPFLTFWGLNSIFLGYFFSSTNTKTIFWGIKTTNSYRIRSFRPQISFFPRIFLGPKFQRPAAHPHQFSDRVPPPPPPPPPPIWVEQAGCVYQTIKRLWLRRLQNATRISDSFGCSFLMVRDNMSFIIFHLLNP